MVMEVCIGHVGKEWMLFGIAEKWSKGAIRSQTVYRIEKTIGIIAHILIGG